jgi:hypothetical protein
MKVAIARLEANKPTVMPMVTELEKRDGPNQSQTGSEFKRETDMP